MSVIATQRCAASIQTPHAAAEVTLSRAEAVAVDSLLMYTGGYAITLDDSPAGVEAGIRRLRLEAAIRDGGGWWDHDARPGMLDTRVKLGEDGCEEHGDATCPATFTLSADAAHALAELLPIAFGDTLAEDVDTVRRVAARLGVETPQTVSS